LEFAGFQEVVFDEGVEVGEGLLFEFSFSEGGVRPSISRLVRLRSQSRGPPLLLLCLLAILNFNLIVLGDGNLFQRVSQFTIVEKESKH
jgi:hypothetical protein